MDKLKDVLVYIIQEYPYKDELSNARLTKLVYLSDWKSVLNDGRKITHIKWYFDNYGPFVHDIEQTVKDNPAIFKSQVFYNLFGHPKTTFGLKNIDYEPKLSVRERRSIDFAIKRTKDLNWSDFIKLIYSTYPVISSNRYSNLNLIEKAKEYKKYTEQE